MFNQPYFVPRFPYRYPPFMMHNMMIRQPFFGLRGLGSTRRGMGMFNWIGNRIHAFRGINWSNIIQHTSKTLGVINQAIPVVRQVGPMMNNVRSMLKIASVFKDETDNGGHGNSVQVPKSSISSSDSFVENNGDLLNASSVQQKIYENDYSPVFFVH